jgi:hypothetical protein
MATAAQVGLNLMMNFPSKSANSSKRQVGLTFHPETTLNGPPNIPSSNKKADVAEHVEEFHQRGFSRNATSLGQIVMAKPRQTCLTLATD